MQKQKTVKNLPDSYRVETNRGDGAVAPEIQAVEYEPEPGSEVQAATSVVKKGNEPTLLSPLL